MSKDTTDDIPELYLNRLGKVFSLDLILAIQAALPTKSFIGQDAKCFKAVQGYIST